MFFMKEKWVKIIESVYTFEKREDVAYDTFMKDCFQMCQLIKIVPHTNSIGVGTDNVSFVFHKHYFIVKFFVDENKRPKTQKFIHKTKMEEIKSEEIRDIIYHWDNYREDIENMFETNVKNAIALECY